MAVDLKTDGKVLNSGYSQVLECYRSVKVSQNKADLGHVIKV